MVTSSWRLLSARRTIDEIVEGETYGWFGDHRPSTDTRKAPAGSVRDEIIDSYRNMIAGKKVGPGDVSLMVKRIMWTSGEVYPEYDDLSPDSICHVAVSDSSWFHVFKCLSNYNGTPSTVRPDISDVGPNDESYRTLDGYEWKYMFSVADAVDVRMGSSELMPLSSNSTVEAAAVDGAVDAIKVEFKGEGYSNYLTGTFASSHLRVSGNSVVYALAGNTGASSSNGQYANCVMLISGGTGAGQYREIVQYVSNSAGRFAVIDEEFTVSPTNGSQWEVYPLVRIVGQGDEIRPAAARAIIHPSGNTVDRVEMLDRGEGYTYVSATVEAHPVVGVTAPAVVRGIYSPPGGHGSDPAAELGARHVCVSVVFDGDENGTIPSDGTYRRIGLVSSPTFANVVVVIDQSNGTFLAEEKVYKIERRHGSDTAQTSIGNNELVLTSTNFIRPGDVLYLKSDVDHQLLTVNTVTNSTHVVTTTDSIWTSSVAEVSVAMLQASATVVGSNSTTLRVTELDGPLLTGDEIIGEFSGAWATVDYLERSGETKGLNTFVQLSRISGPVTAGSFQPNEFVYQGESLANSTASGLIHSVTETGPITSVYVSNQVGEFVIGQQAFGSVSGAAILPSTKYGGEIKQGSGKIIHIEDITPVTRSPNQRETINVILES